MELPRRQLGVRFRHCRRAAAGGCGRGVGVIYLNTAAEAVERGESAERAPGGASGYLRLGEQAPEVAGGGEGGLGHAGSLKLRE